jgi:hypothetical protein
VITLAAPGTASFAVFENLFSTQADLTPLCGWVRKTTILGRKVDYDGRRKGGTACCGDQAR